MPPSVALVFSKDSSRPSHFVALGMISFKVLKAKFLLQGALSIHQVEFRTLGAVGGRPLKGCSERKVPREGFAFPICCTVKKILRGKKRHLDTRKISVENKGIRLLNFKPVTFPEPLAP